MFLVLREEVELAHYDARAFGNGRERIIRKRYRKSRLLSDELIEPTQLGSDRARQN